MAEDFAIGRALVIPQSVMNNLNKIDEKINLIASDSEKMATHFASAMTRMDGSTDNLLKRLSEMQTKINNIDMSKFAQGVTNVSQGVSQIEQFSKAITKAAAAINKYNSSQVKRTNVDNTKEINKLNKEIEALKKKTEQLEKYRQKQQQVNKEQSSTRTNTKAIDAYNRAMASSEAIVTQRINKIAKLRQAEEMLTKASGDYSVQIKRIRQEIERLNKLNQGQVDAYGRIIKSQRNLMDTSGQLSRQLALIFSVSQIEGYIMKLVKVRGEFELQNTALASILQNKDQADKLFGQITELAVKSPFTVKELTTYTKSLAAYQVQYEDLYDTTKMLADVSAGLGVDMQRLILAFGQVKAANFLRGTETRQFTEAGINMLGELAKYYTELEGRIVSVSEVQDRQFKKMISFQDVEQVFKRLTSAGGMFYNMQEKQAETIAGQMSNLQDTIDLMLNDIGKANDSTIRLMLSTIKSIVENWEILANVIKTAGTTFALYYVKVMLASAANGAFAKSTIAATVAQGGLVGATGKVINAIKSLATIVKSNPFLAIASAVTLAGYELYDHAKKVEENKKAYDVFTNSVKQTQTEFGKITSRVTEQNQKIKETLEKVSSLKKGTKEYSDAENEANKQREKMSTLLEELNSKFPDVYESIIKQKDGTVDLTEAQALLNEQLERTTYLSYLSRQTETFWSDGLVENIKDASEAQQKYKLSSDDLSNAYTQMTARIKEYFATNKYASKDLQKQLDDIANSSLSSAEKIQKMYSVVSNVSGVNIGDLRRIIYDYQYEAQKNIDANNKLEDSNESLAKSIEQIAGGYKLAFDTSSEEGRRAAKEATEEFIRLLDIKNEAVRKFVQTQFEINIGVKLDIDNKKTPELSEMGKRINNYLDNMNFTLIPKIDAGEGTVKFFNELKEEYKSLTEEAEKIKRASQELYPDTTNAQRLEEINNKMIQVKKTLKDWGELEDEKNNKSKDNAELKRLNEQISLIKKASEEYKKLRQYSGKEEATAKVRDSFGDAFKNLGLDIGMTFDTTGIINGLESLYKSVGDEGKKILDESLASIRTQQEIEIKAKGVEKIQEQLDDLFAGYELSVELDKMGLDNNLISQLFNVDTFSLEDVRSNLDKLKNEVGASGTEYEKVFEEAEKKITEMQQNELQERLKSYAKYLKKSVTERVAIELEAQKEIAKVQATSELTPQQKEQVTKNIREEASKKKQEQTWKEFQDSDLYIRMFEDLESASTKSLDLMEQKLLEYRDSLKKLDPSDLKEITNLLEKMREIKIDRNPFKGFVSNLKEVIKYQNQADELNKKYAESLSKQEYLSGLVESQELSIDSAQKRYNEQVKLNKAGSDEAINAKLVLSSQQRELESTRKLLEKQKEITNEYGKQISLGDKKTAQVNEQINKIGSYGSQAVNSLTELTDMLSNFGIDFGETFSGVVSGLGQAFQGLEQIDITKPMSIITGAVSVVSGIGNAIASIFGAGDNKKEKEIQRQLELLENLQYAYEKLEKAIDDAYSIDTYKKATKQSIANLEEQNKALQAAIAAESRKKGGGDKDRIKEWMQQMEDNEEAIAQLIKDQISTVTAGILDDGLSAADAFVDAWLEAFQETGDGLQGLEDNFNEMLLNMIKRQAAMSIVAPLIENMQKELEKYINKDDTDLTISEAEKFAEYVKNQLPEVSAALENLFNGLKDVGLEFGDTGDTMSSLQRGITSVSEETAQALEALLNSVRFFTSDSNAVLHNIYNAITIPNVENPFLAELKVQSEQLRLLYGLFNGIIKNVSGSGKAMSVRIV